VFQRPLQHGADLALYSLTKYVGGHSDLVAGGVVGSRAMMTPVRALRGALGTQLDAHTAWMIMRSMETLSLRMHRSAENARLVAEFLRAQPKVAAVNYPASCATAMRAPKCSVASAAVPVPRSASPSRRRGRGPPARCPAVIKLAVSLGGTETLMSHPASTTHSGVPKATRDRLGVTDAVIRISVGIENAADLIADLTQSLAAV
jgi:methionine-gamma-lyase